MQSSLLIDKQNPYNANTVLCLAFVLLFASALCIPFDYTPLQDYSEWIFQSQIFNRLLSGDHSDQFSIKPYPVPYAVSQLIISAVLNFFSPYVSSKIFILIFLLFSLFSIYCFIIKRQLDKTCAPLFMLSIVVFNSCFWSGYIGYQIGLSIFCIYVAQSKSIKTNPYVISIYSVILFFSHGLIYIPFCLLIIVYSLFLRKQNIFLGLLPSFSLVIIYILSKSEQNAIANQLVIDNYSSFVFYKIYTLLKLGSYQNLIFFDIDDSKIAKFIPLVGFVLNTLFVLFLFLSVWALLRKNFRSASNLNWDIEAITAGILFLLFLISPATAAGIVNPGERFLYPALILLSPLLFHNNLIPLINRKCLSATVAIGLLYTLNSALLLSKKNEIASDGLHIQLADKASSPASGHIFFGHNLLTFDRKMKETQLAWYANQMPNCRLFFQTSLLIQH
ncbi:MAG: hypothetical protein ABSB19_20750 [Methylomonas sp.]|jgi:hypothetical protein